MENGVLITSEDWEMLLEYAIIRIVQIMGAHVYTQGTCLTSVQCNVQSSVMNVQSSVMNVLVSVFSFISRACSKFGWTFVGNQSE